MIILPYIFADRILPCGNWTLYKQCDSRWASHPLGNGGGNTICSAGCAMSSVSMALATKKETIDGQVSTPLSLNNWLDKNGGFVGGDELVWNAVAKLGKVHMEKYVSTLTRAELKSYTTNCQPVVVNVRDGSHWVLVVGYDPSNENNFYVNDPGFDQTIYDFRTMLRFVVYTA